MKNLAFLILFVSLNSIAAPSKLDASKWLKDFRSAREKTTDALFLNDAVKRSKHTQTILALRDRSHKIFPQTSECIAASEALFNMWSNEIELVTNQSQPNLSATGLSHMAWEGGQNYYICRETVDSMK